WALFGLSVPGFWLGMILIYVFSALLKLVPLQGYVSPLDDFWGSLRTMILPALTLGVFLSGPQTRYLRASVLDVLAPEHGMVATGFVLINIVVDALYAFLDPRIRLSGGQPR